MSEKFARVVENKDGKSYLLVGKDWPCGEGSSELELLGLEEGAEQMNYYHEAAIKRAVEEFRERAVKIIEDNDEVVSSEHGRFLQAKRGAIGNQIGTAYVKAIRALPTESEAK